MSWDGRLGDNDPQCRDMGKPAPTDLQRLPVNHILSPRPVGSMKSVIVLFHENGQKIQMIPMRSGHPAHSESVGSICQQTAEGDLLLFIDSDEQKHSKGGGGAWQWSSRLLEPAPSFLCPRHFNR